MVSTRSPAETGLPGRGSPTRSTGESVISVSDLRMRYGTLDVLDGVSFSAQQGEVPALLGPNDAGKSTTIEILEASGCGRAGR